MNEHMQELLTVQSLSVSIPGRFGEFTAVQQVSLTVRAGEIHALVGESGAGKSTIGAAIIGLLEHPAHVSQGSITLNGEELTTYSEERYHALRGRRISMIFQDPQTSLNPLLSIGDQLVETIVQHRPMAINEARELAVSLLEETGIHDARQRQDDYPHQFSGGMRQRVVIALALCTNPDLIIADEPTTALDVSVQKQILQLIRTLARQRQVGIILITHDIGVIAQVSDRVTVLRAGRQIETGNTAQVLGDPQQTYTRALMAAVPRLDKRLERFVNIVTEDDEPDDQATWRIAGASAQYASNWLLGASPMHSTAQSSEDRTEPSDGAAVLSVQDLSVRFAQKSGWLQKKAHFTALANLSLHIRRSEVLGVVGESGSGKSTLAKAIVGLVPYATGSINFKGHELPSGPARSRTHPARRQIQMVFQDPYSSLNNRRSIEAILTEPLRFYGLAKPGAESRKLVASVLTLVGLPQRAMSKYPHQFSGGQRQRIAVARALMARPEFLICDEPTSALDVSIQAQVLNLLKDLQANFGLTILFISHNLAVVRQMADRVVVLKQGQHIETADTESFFAGPQASYSRQLLEETPSLALVSDAS